MISVKWILLILLITTTFAAAYEVIFHEGFEGEQFPPAGWETYGWVEHYSPGYDSEWCAESIPTYPDKNCSVTSREVDIESGELYEFRFYSRTSSDGLHRAAVHFDDSSSVFVDLPYIVIGGYDWTQFSMQVYAPDTASNVHFNFRSYYIDPGIWFYWYIDNVSIIHTATSVTPASFGHIKAVYR
jgi:hypothetical protein